ncbi:MAG: arginase family protein [Candidatus Woesearchaeota archaeon]
MKKEPLIIGMPFDNGIRSMLNLGRGTIGSSEAPEFIFKQLDKNDIKVDKINKVMLDLKKFNIEIKELNNFNNNEKNNLTLKAHEIVENEILKYKDKLIISIGGDHSLSYPIFKSLNKNSNSKLSIVLFDAHFDMRSNEEEGIISSGNSFYRILKENLCEEILVIGINKSDKNAFKKQLNFAKQNNVKIIFIDELNENSLNNALDKIKNPIYLSIDIDVLNEKYAPGVSARNKLGLSVNELLNYLNIIFDKKLNKKQNEIISIDIMEASLRNNDNESLEITSKAVIKIIKAFLEKYKY